MDQRLEKLEQLQRDMQDQIEERLEKIQREMRESQDDMMAKLTQLLKGGKDKGKDPIVNVEEGNSDEPLYPPGFTPLHAHTQAEINNSGENPTNLIVPDLDDVAEVEKTKVDLSKQLEDRCKWLEEKFKAMESADYHRGMDAKDLSLVPDLILPPKFKMPEFEKYDGTSCPDAHITMFCRRMTGYINNEQLLVHCFQDSLIGSAARWYNQLSRAEIHSWKDLAQAFIKQYRHVMDIAPDRIVLQNMEKKTNESFRQYARRWREVAAQVQPPLLEKEITMLFINTLKAPFLNHMLGSATKSFSDIVMSGEMIENAIRSGKIKAGESAKRSAPRKKEHEINNTSMFNKDHSRSITVGQARATTTNQQGSSRRESNSRPNIERPQFTPIPVTYKELYQNLFDAHVIGDSSGPNVAENSLPNHDDNRVNAISENEGRRVKGNVAEIKTPLGWVWKQMVKRGLIKQDSIERPEQAKRFCEFHAEEDHDIQECTEFRIVVQNFMDSKEMEFYDEIKGLKEEEVCATGEGSARRTQELRHPVDNKKVPWSYDCNVTIPGKESSVNASEKKEGFYTRSGKRYDPADAIVESGKEKALAVELGKTKTDEIESSVNQPVLNETYVTKDISVNKLDRLVNNINADNFIFFNDDEIPPGGRGSTKALHITARCGEYMLAGVLIDNGSALNVLPLSTLSRLPVDNSHMRSCQNIVRAFDGTERKVIGRIEVPLLIGPNTYDVDFLVMDIKPSYNCLLGRPWIHSAGAVPSSLHQKLKLVIEGRLITIDTEEDIIALVTNDTPYLGIDDEAVECSFRSLEFVNATFVIGGKKIPTPSMSKATRMGLQATVRKGAVPGRGLGRCLQGRMGAPRRKELEKRQDRRKARLNGKEVDWEPMAFPHISRTFMSGGTMYSELRAPRKKTAEEMLRNLSINAICEEEFEGGSTSQDINDMSDSTMDLENLFEQDMCPEESQDFEDNTDCNLSPDLLRMVEQEEK
ncbi:uncharacterized protein [Gossypium hirsutum]|uniref:Retrotransposon gag domain-containing protein n=1 Tax=Gossypium hirsutum TaxID=3635 RepID=A0ABM3A1I4_GOSHI|nr:uncharacterized protein LOC121217277 [Gossypium hirsutum]